MSDKENFEDGYEIMVVGCVYCWGIVVIEVPPSRLLGQIPTFDCPKCGKENMGGGIGEPVFITDVDREAGIITAESK